MKLNWTWTNRPYRTTFVIVTTIVGMFVFGWMFLLFALALTLDITELQITAKRW